MRVIDTDNRDTRARARELRPGRCFVIGTIGACVLTACASSRTSSSHATSMSPPTVPCGDSIRKTASGNLDGYRIVFGVVSVPPTFLSQVVATPGQAWPYWRKAGVALRSGRTAATVSVPPEWRGRLAITWGSAGIVTSLRFARCPSTPPVWRAYAGGFYLRSRKECVPLEIRVGSRRRVVHFGIGRSCRGR
jgi:hypothetical protein